MIASAPSPVPATTSRAEPPHPKVSVAMITYNHERFIAQAVESVLAQQAPFAIELVIGEDCSTDGTREILRRLAAEHPDQIRLLARERNMGFARNSLDVIAQCRGDYLALLEGDDYWVAKDRIARQVAFLEANPSYSLCFGRADYLIDQTGQILPGAVGPDEPKATFDLDDLLTLGNIVPTASVVLRRKLLDQQALARHSLVLPVGDFVSNLLLAMKGPLGYFPEVFYVYRAHSGGVFSLKPKTTQVKASIAVYDHFGRHYELSERPSFRRGYSRLQLELFRALRRADGFNARLTAARLTLRHAPATEKPRVLFALFREIWARWRQR